MTNNQPSLNDILRPLLEAKGWEPLVLPDGTCWQTGPKAQTKDIMVTHEVRRVLGNGCSQYVGGALISNPDVRAMHEKYRDCKCIYETLHPSDPQFFEKLEVWLSE